MKARLLLLLLLVFSKGVLAQWTEEPSYDPHPGRIAQSAREQASAAAEDLYDVTYYRLFFKVDPGLDSISGCVTTYFHAKTAALSELRFDLLDQLQVDSVVYHHGRLTFTHTGNGVNIILPVALAEEQLDSITVYYQGIPGSSGNGSFTQSTHNGVPVIWTLSEPYGASEWWPCKQSLRDKADSIDTFINTPSQYRTAANGLLVDSVQKAGRTTWHWKHRYPVAHYLVCMAVTNYASYYDRVPLQNGDTLPVLNLVYPENLADARLQSSYIVPVMQVYNSLFGLYPFAKEKYGHAQFGWGGGMEHQTMTFVDNFEGDLLAHELGHQWFGDKITLGTWRDIWLNEGFATYLTGLASERLNPSDWHPWIKRTLQSASHVPCGSVYVDDTSSLQRIFSGALSYSKGAMVLHMLRWKLGDTSFFAALKSYINDPALAYKNAVTPDLQAHFEQACGCDLSSFFNKWVYGQGYPSYTVFWKQDSARILHLTINQATSCSQSVAFFEMPVPVEVSGSGHDTTFVLDHSYSGQEFTCVPGFVISKLSFDPYPWILSNNNAVYETGLPGADEVYIAITPNPTGGLTEIRVNKPAAISNLSLYDVYGNKLWDLDKPFLRNEGQLEIDLGGLAAGVYLAVFKTAGNRITKKIVVE